MDLEIEVSPEPKDASNLIRWLEAEDSLTLKDLRQRSEPAKTGEMGPELLPVVTAVLVSPLLTELAKSVFGWLTATNREEPIKVTIDGKSVEFAASDIDSVNEIIDKLTRDSNDRS